MAWAWRGSAKTRSRGPPRCCSPTSRRATSTRRRVQRSSSSSSRSTASGAARSCSSRTTRHSPRTPTGGSRCATAASSGRKSQPPSATCEVIRFALAMAARETRAGWRHVLTVLVCVALGVASLVSVGSLAVELKLTLAREAKTLLGGDVEVRAPRAVPAGVVEAIERLHGSGAALAHTRELVGMARTGTGASLLVEVKAVEGAYPLYGA